MKRWVGVFALFMVFCFTVSAWADPGRLVKGRYVRGQQVLPLTGFVVHDRVNTPVNLSSTSTPGLEYDDYQVNVVWADSETTPIEQTFRVPDDYNGDGYFEAFFSRSSTGDPPSVDFDIFVHRDGTAPDSSATNQTAVELSVGSVSSPQKTTLTPATDNSSILAGDIVTFRVWRDNTDTSTDDLELKGDVVFIYDPLF